MCKLKVYRRRQEEIKDSCSYMNMEEFFNFQICISIYKNLYIYIDTHILNITSFTFSDPEGKNTCNSTCGAKNYFVTFKEF